MDYLFWFVHISVCYLFTSAALQLVVEKHFGWFHFDWIRPQGASTWRVSDWWLPPARCKPASESLGCSEVSWLVPFRAFPSASLLPLSTLSSLLPPRFDVQFLLWRTRAFIYGTLQPLLFEFFLVVFRAWILVRSPGLTAPWSGCVFVCFANWSSWLVWPPPASARTWRLLSSSFLRPSVALSAGSYFGPQSKLDFATEATASWRFVFIHFLVLILPLHQLFS